ncbi:MAG: Glutamyl-tRNA(Gln) amidotransferase subunit B, chloroplastic/mitochondrial [Mycoplasmataceae bacterium]|nr:MAG: Glutamyl-tRNA(Gln) amidotransferase subunit B, chloroplastic/mitochondrial [Mycoplasmataceae bacterium]
MNNLEQEPKILLGLEIHITVNSQKKIFNWENVYRGNVSPNSKVGAWELGYLGALPIINPEVVNLGLKLASALEMEINPILTFDRKIYNYFDLPKGYQITQQQFPFAINGRLPIVEENKIKKIAIRNLQIEEDTAKSSYSNEGVRLDFNRAGNPLIELVTEPVFQKIETVLIFIKQLQNLCRYLDISEAKMEQGQLRVDLNFSLRFGDNYSTPRYEIKNLNSLMNIEKSLNYEINKHRTLFLQNEKPPTSQTLGFDEEKQITVIHREKTNYYYLPEVNIPPIKLKKTEINQIKKKLPKLPWIYWEELKKLDIDNANKIVNNPSLLRILNFLSKKKVLISQDIKGWNTFYLNYLSAHFGSGNDIDLFVKKWKSYNELFVYWKEKKIGNEEIKEIINFLLTTKNNFSSLIKKYEKKTIVNEEVVEEKLKSLWNNELTNKLNTDRQRVQNYLLGQIKKEFSDYPIKEIVLIINNYLNKLKIN